MAIRHDGRGVLPAEGAKRALTTIARTKVVLGAGGVTRTIDLTREDFENATSGLLSRARDLTEMVLDDAGLGWAAIDRMLLAGGSTRMPMVRSLMETTSGMAPERSINPDEVVALGAAIQASIVGAGTAAGGVPATVSGAQIVVRDVTSHGLGTLAQVEQTTRMENVVIIPHNTRIPAKRSNVFRTVADHQTEIRVEVTVGDESDPEYVKMIGEQILRIPPYPAGAPVDVTFAYDIDQTVFIEVTDLTTNRSLGTFEVHDVANMEATERDRAIDKIRALEVS